jgi:hypothetical protein
MNSSAYLKQVKSSRSLAYDANRGGLLVELEGIRGFLPVSQLAAGHYPRVSGADKDEILQKLGALTSKPFACGFSMSAVKTIS